MNATALNCPSQVAVLPTCYDGIVFRSRTEARWAVFFNALGISFQYEKEGFQLESGAYLPDFWIDSLHCWFEVNGQKPSRAEMRKCRELADATKKMVILAIGQPSNEDQLIIFENGSSAGGWLYRFIEDRKNQGRLWVESQSAGHAIAIGYGPHSDLWPGVGCDLGLVNLALRASKMERFWDPKDKSSRDLSRKTRNN